jgi:hypothetical protein
VGLQWFIEADGVVVYATGCETVRLD